MTLREPAHPRILLPGLLFAAVAGFHFITSWAGGPARNWHGQTSEYYGLLTDAFLAGQTNLLVQPSAALLALPDPYDHVTNAPFRLHDASLYRGKYYLYFGPTPAIVLFLPYQLLTGSPLPSRLAVAWFCAAGFACSCALFFLLVKREAWECPRWLASTAVVSLGTATGVAFLVTRPSFYEVAISAGYCFVMAGFLLFARALGGRPPQWPSLAGAGLCFGLAAGCRPTLALLAALMFVVAGWRLRLHKTRALAFMAPIVLCGLLLGAYNYARFQNPFEFGNRFQLIDGVQNQGNPFGLSKVVPAAYYLIFAPPRVAAHSPLVRPSDSLAAFANLPEGLSVGPTIGLLWVAPLALLGLMAPMLWPIVPPGSTRFTMASLYISAIGIMAVFALLGWIAGRYLMDFAPQLVLISCLLLAALWRQKSAWRAWQTRLFQSAVVAATLYSAILDLATRAS